LVKKCKHLITNQKNRDLMIIKKEVTMEIMMITGRIKPRSRTGKVLLEIKKPIITAGIITEAKKSSFTPNLPTTNNDNTAIIVPTIKIPDKVPLICGPFLC